MPAKKKTTKKKAVGAKEGILIGAGVAAAAAAGYFLFGPKGKQNRKKIKAWTVKAKGEVLEKIEGLEHLAEDKYHKIVDQVASKYMKKMDIANEDVELFTKELKKYWKHIEKDLAPKKKKAPAKKKATPKKKKATTTKKKK